ncbi:MAG TPA: cytochrome d ubiquinol oxidase subunit II [Verrucomicrobiae bacterium]|nr:cytochrome d ubiquinol oxidase subunit II [Verrucomicrobiae bacterium]
MPFVNPLVLLMKKSTSFVLLLLVVLAVLCGYLLSKASLVGKVGITLIYKEYSFLKVWWQGALAVFACWLLLFFIQGWAQRNAKGSNAVLPHIAALVLAAIGLFFTYQDFSNNLSHRLLGERFHLGGYLFWVGWMIISLAYLFRKKK